MLTREIDKLHSPLKSSLVRIAERLMRSPAAPYHESAVAAEVRRFCAEQRLACHADSFGNLLIELNPEAKTPPFVLAAHLDHPGFVVRSRVSRRSWAAEFRGGVPDDYFQRGVRVRLHPGDIPARLGRRLNKNRRIFELKADALPSSPPEFAVWDLPAFASKRGRIMGRACDDLIGAATILDVLASLARTRLKTRVIGVLSRAEEVGFHGALALAQSRHLPPDSFVISLETSRELPPVKMGAGVIVRVGDRASTFDSAGTRFLVEIASGLAMSDERFRFQRALMSGGTCEATAYQEHGYRCAAVCVALGNYHNCGSRHRIAPEYVSLSDAEGMARLLQLGARRFARFETLARRLPKRLAAYTRKAVRELKQVKLKA